MLPGPILIASTFGIFVKPLAETFGWSRGAISLGFSIIACIGSLAAPVVGVLADRLGPRKVILVAAVLFGSGLCSFAFLSGSIWHFYALYVFTAFGSIGLTTIPYATAISRWFVRQRGLALGFMGVGAFVGGMYAPPLVTYVIATWGWRWAYATLGLLVWILILPVIGLFLIESPRQLGLRPDGDTEDGNSPPVSLSPASPSGESNLHRGKSHGAILAHGGEFFPAQRHDPRLYHAPRSVADRPGSLRPASGDCFDIVLSDGRDWASHNRLPG